MFKKYLSWWLSPAGGGSGGGVWLRGGRSFLVPLMWYMAVLSVFGFLGNGGASAAADNQPLAIQTFCQPLAGMQ